MDASKSSMNSRTRTLCCSGIGDVSSNLVNWKWQSMSDMHKGMTENVIHFQRNIKFDAETIELPFNSNITPSSSVFVCVSFIGVVFVTRATFALSSNLWLRRSNSQSYAWTYTTESKWWQLLHSQRLCFGNQIAHCGLEHVWDEQRLHVTILSISDFDSESSAVAAVLKGLWHTEQNSNCFSCADVLCWCCCCSIDDGDDDDDDVVARFVLLFEFDSVFLLSGDFFKVGLVLSVIFLLKKDQRKKIKKQTRKTGTFHP